MESEVFDRIREYLADQLDVDPDKITPDSDIVEDFGADSLDVVDMITTLSDEFGVDIPDEEIENFHTVGDVVQYVEDDVTPDPPAAHTQGDLFILTPGNRAPKMPPGGIVCYNVVYCDENRPKRTPPRPHGRESVRSLSWQTTRKNWSRRSPRRRSTLPSGTPTSAKRPSWWSIPALRALWCCAPTATPCGRTSRKTWTPASRPPATRTWPCPC